MITTIATTLVTPFMVAAAPEAAPVEPTQANYNWVEQKVETGCTIEESTDCGQSARASFSYIPGGRGAQCVDDWYLA